MTQFDCEVMEELGNSNIKLIATSATAGATLAALTVAGAAGISAYFARQVVVPPRRPYETTKILGLGYNSAETDQHAHPTSVTLEASDATLAPGTYGLFFNGGKDFARIGKILSYNPTGATVTREIEKVHGRRLEDVTRGRMSGVVSPSPETSGYYADEVLLDLEDGMAPAWVIHPGAYGADHAGEPSKVWGVMVHGMGATRAETLRALEATQQLGISTLHMSYRNDEEAAPSDDGRYGLGFTEWRDVEVAIDFALNHGAEKVILFGWSMGGAIVLQAADRAYNKSAVLAMVLDGPAVDWLDLISYHSSENKLPRRLGKLGTLMISKPMLNVFTGLKKPIRLERLSWLRRAHEIKVPTLIVHSVDDTYVPVEPSRKLARKSPLVDFVPFEKATHTREWNVDPERWTKTVVSWVNEKVLTEKN